LCFGFERAPAASRPQGKRMIAFFALQLARDRQERAIERGAIIAG
jgi:hypothetical protein